jgi:hypothetical protein
MVNDSFHRRAFRDSFPAQKAVPGVARVINKNSGLETIFRLESGGVKKD